MASSTWTARLVAAFGLLGTCAAPALAQGTGFGVGEWDLVAGGSVCRVELTDRLIPRQNNFRAIVRPDGRCSDWRMRNLAMWVVRGNDLKLGDREGREIASLAQQGPNRYASGGWELRRVGYGYDPGPRPRPRPGYRPPGDRPGQGDGLGEWSFINRSNGSVCHVSLTDQLIRHQSAYRAYTRGGPGCHDWMGRSVAMWVVRGNSLHLADGNGREVAKLEPNGRNQYAAGGLILQRR